MFYNNQLFSRRGQLDRTSRFTPPKPYTAMKSENQPLSDGHKVQISQQLNFQPFDKFNELIETVNNWIFQKRDDESMLVDSDDVFPWQKFNTKISSTESSVTPFEHGLICTMDLCLTVLFKVDEAVRKNPVNQAA